MGGHYEDGPYGSLIWVNDTGSKTGTMYDGPYSTFEHRENVKGFWD